MGLNSGQVVVGKIGDDLRMDYTAQGHTVGLAERMEQLAEEGRPYLGAETASLVEGYFEIEELGEFTVKGTREPLVAFALTGTGPARTRLDVSRARGFTRFVGRGDEMESLEAALRHAAEGNGQVVGVVGEAGVGKSRLCLEFVEERRAEGIAVYEAHCPAHGKALALLPIRELLRNAFGVAARDPDRVARDAIAGRLLVLDEAFRAALPLVFDFLGVPDPAHPAPQIDPDARHRQLCSFLRRLVHAWSEREPTVVVIDDLHWIDEGSDTLLAELVEAVAGTRTLLLVNFRPEYRADWMRKSSYQQLPLSPLGPEASGELLHALLGEDPSVGGLPDLIRGRTQGNPFFIEEVVLSPVDGGALRGARGSYQQVAPIGAIEIPTTVMPVLAARIDRLPERAKQMLQTASVIGKRFSEALLARVAEADVAAAQADPRCGGAGTRGAARGQAGGTGGAAAASLGARGRGARGLALARAGRSRGQHGSTRGRPALAPRPSPCAEPPGVRGRRRCAGACLLACTRPRGGGRHLPGRGPRCLRRRDDPRKLARGPGRAHAPRDLLRTHQGLS
jgi:hypothetical protein